MAGKAGAVFPFFTGEKTIFSDVRECPPWDRCGPLVRASPLLPWKCGASGRAIDQQGLSQGASPQQPSGGSTISFAWLKHDVIDAQCRIRRNGRKAV